MGDPLKLGDVPWISLKVANLKCFRDPQGFERVEAVNVIVGRNNSGKSTLLDLLQYATDWRRHPANPIIRPGVGKWDEDAVYKPYAILDGQRWLLWYNGRRGGVEQIGLATHEGEDLGF